MLTGETITREILGNVPKPVVILLPMPLFVTMVVDVVKLNNTQH